MDASKKGGMRHKVLGVIHRLIQRTFISYVLLFASVAAAVFLVLHYQTDLFKDAEGHKLLLEQAGAAAGVALLAAGIAFFARLL